MDIKQQEEEIKKKFGKNRTNSTRARFASGCNKAVLFVRMLDWPQTNNYLFRYNHDTQTEIQMSGDHTLMGKTIAVWDNMLYTINNGCGDPLYDDIIEFELDYLANTFTFVRSIALGNTGVLRQCGTNNAATMKDAGTMIINWVASGGSGPLEVIDITGSIAQYVQPSYTPPYPPDGDMVYLADTNQVLVTTNSGASRITLYDLPTGNVMATFPFQGNAATNVKNDALYLHDDKIYAPIWEDPAFGPSGIREIIVSGNTITIGNQWDPNQFSDGNTQDLKWRDSDSGCVSTNSGNPVTTPCYNIGDIGPGGGIVFALPNTGINNSNFVYEINADPIQLATTQLALLPNECKNQKPLIIKTRDVGQTVPNNAIVVDYGPGSNNPSFFPSDINVGDILNAFDINGNGLFSPGVVPTVTLKTLLPNNFVFIAFSAFMNGPANSQPSETVTFYTTPGFVPVNGAEWGGYDKPIITSELFGEGKKNTDIIAAVTQTNNPPSHPTVPSHDIAADLTLAFSQNNLDDWFLPSYEELEEAFNVLGSNGLDMLPNPTGINNEKTVYWTSTGLNPVNNQLIGNVNSNELAWCYITPFNTTFLYRKCKTLSVLPVRRFECPEDKGIRYDYRLAKSSVGGFGAPAFPSFTPGNIGYMGDDMTSTLDVGEEFSIDVQVMANGTDPSGFSQPSAQYPNGIGPGDVVVEPLPGTGGVAGPAMIGFTWDSGSTQFDPSSWGPMQYITPSGKWVFDDPGFFAQTGLPIGTVKNMTGNNYQTISNPYWTGPAVFVNKNTEIGRPWLTIKLSGHDVRLNYVKGIMRSFPGYNGLHTNKFDPPNDTGGTRKFKFNIKVYTQFEELIADYDYSLKSPTISNFCSHTRCTWELYGDLLNVNYVNPAYATDPNHPSVIDIRKHFGRPSNPSLGFGGSYGQFSDEGHGYVSIELLDTEFVDPQGIFAATPLRWTNYNPPSWSNGRGNTLNLQNWMGTGLNRRATDPNNLPPEWSTVWNRFPWGAVCYPCGFWQNNCTNIRKREWMAELPYSSFTYWGYTQGLQNFPFDCTGNLSMTPNVVTIPSWGSHLGTTPALSYPNIPYSQVINAFTDLTIGHPCNPPVPPNDPDFVGDPNSKVIEITSETIKNFTGNENYDKETKDCIQQSNIAKDYEQFKNSLGIEEAAIMINIDNPNESFIDDNFSVRQNFVENNKETKETGPFAIAGYYPLYDTIKGARFASTIPLEARDNEDTHGYHIHEFNGIEYYMPNGLELGVTQFHGDYVVEEQQKTAPALCSYDDIKKAAGAIMYPVYATSPQAMNIWYNNFITFQQNMWAHFQNAGCSWWVNRINIWTSQLPSITNAYQLALKNAKIDFAYQMNSVCGCPPIPPVAPQPVLKVAETIEEVEIIQDEQDIQPIEPVYTPPPIIIPPEEDEESPPTYTPTPSRPSGSGSSGSGGY